MSDERRFTDEQLQHAKQVDLLALMRSRGVEPVARGASWQARCPFHDDDTPSLVVTPAKGLWQCFGCGVAGDAIRFIELHDKVTFVEAVKTLLAFAGAGETSTPCASTPEQPVAPTVSPAERTKLLTRVAAHYHRAFLECPEGRRYLEDVRGIRDAALFKTFQIGLANGSLLDVLPQDADTLAQLRAIGVLTAAGREFFRGCVVFPLWDADGAIGNLYGRRLVDGEVNHLYLPGTRTGLWNAQAARRSDSVMLAESIIDALSAIEAGAVETMPVYGVNGLSDELVQWLLKCGVRRVVLAFDGDEAGRRGMDAAQRRLADAGLAVGRLALPEGQDLNSALCGPHAGETRAALLPQVGAAFAALASSPDADAASAALPGEQLEPTPSGFRLSLHGRRYEVKGIARVITQLKATVKATGDARKGFELTTLDLYSARSREAYAKACAVLFGVTDDVIRADLGRLIEHVEAWQPGATAIEAAPVSSPADEARAQTFLTDPKLLDEVLADLVTLGVAGEETNKLLCYLAVVSRKLDDPLSLLIQSRSAAGKSTLQHAVLALTPDEDQVHYTRLTSQALFYQDEARLAHKVLALEEAEGLGDAAYSLRALQSAKKLTVATTTKDPALGQMRTQQYTVQGPVAVLLTTTSAALDEETASRFLTLTIDESRQMTETILAAQRHRDTLEGYLAELDKAQVIAKHQAAQRLLEPLVVLNPFAQQLSFPAHSLRARRDHKKYLMLIKAVAFLHQKQRTVREAERGGQRFRYLEVTRADIAMANSLAAQALSASLDELSAPARNLLRHIHAMVRAHCEAQGVPPAHYVFTRRDIREATGWTEWQVRTHAKELEDLEYLKARNGTWGREYLYELAEADLARDPLEPRRLMLTDPTTLVDAQGAA
jgi:DNA primase catalytic core